MLLEQVILSSNVVSTILPSETLSPYSNQMIQLEMPLSEATIYWYFSTFIFN